MEKLLSNGVRHQKVPLTHIFPPENRAGKPVSVSKTLPVIDLRGGIDQLEPCDRKEIVDQILKAGKEFGLFQVINHGVPTQVMDEMMSVAQEFFRLSNEDKAAYYSEDPRRRPARLSAGAVSNFGEVQFWRDVLQLSCYPVEEFKHLWPEKPSNLRESLATFTMEIRELALRLLRLISEGLELDNDYFDRDLSGGTTSINVNHYPPCPDPSLTFGLPKHRDINLLTLLLQDVVSGLQVCHEVGWIGVEPIPNAIVVDIGCQLEIITNGKLKSAQHRVVTNSTTARTTVATFVSPKLDCIIAPVQSTIDECNQQLYRPFIFQEFVAKYLATKGDDNITMESFLREN